MSLKIRTLVATLLAALSLPTYADLILSGSPSSQDRGEINKHFAVLATQLTEALGEPVRYIAPINEIGYAQEIRKGSYDILIDGPHLAAWRVNKGIHKFVAEAKNPVTFLIVAPATDNSIQSPEQLIGKPVCLQPSPHLSNLMFINLYPNPLQLPETRIVEGFKPITEKVLNGDCRAGVVRAAFYEQTLDKNIQKQLRIVYNTHPLPGNIMTVSAKVSDEKRNALIKRITNADPANDQLLQAMTASGVPDTEPTKVRWEPVKPENIKGLDQLLIKNSYGWE